MIRTIADQYLAQNAGRRYPIADDADWDTGNDAAILDFRAAFTASEGETPRAFLHEVSTEGGGAVKRLVVRIAAGGRHDDVTFDVALPVASASPLTVTSSGGGSVASITVSSAVASLPDRLYDVPMSASVAVAVAAGVSSVRSAGSVDGPGFSEPISGDIFLDAGWNSDPYLDGGRIRLDIVKGGGIGEFCQTESTGQTCGNVLFSINGERPGSDGNLNIRGEGGISVKPVPESNAIEISIGDAAAGLLAEQCARTC